MPSLQFIHLCLHLNLPKANNELSEIIKCYHIQEIMFTERGQEHCSQHFLEAFTATFHYYWEPFGVILKKSGGI